MAKEKNVLGMNMVITKMKELTRLSFALNNKLTKLYNKLYEERNPRKMCEYDTEIRQHLLKISKYQVAIKAQIDAYVKLLDVNRRNAKR